MISRSGRCPWRTSPLATILGPLVGMVVEQGCDLGLDGLRQQRSRASAQDLSQRISKSSWLGELENVSLGHGVSLLRWRSGGFKHPHDTPPHPLMPSPTFPHSSRPSPFEPCTGVGNPATRHVVRCGPCRHGVGDKSQFTTRPSPSPLVFELAEYPCQTASLASSTCFISRRPRARASPVHGCESTLKDESSERRACPPRSQLKPVHWSYLVFAHLVVE
jgi:hypothetical protein